jgi:hypothetical protein
MGVEAVGESVGTSSVTSCVERNPASRVGSPVSVAAAVTDGAGADEGTSSDPDDSPDVPVPIEAIVLDTEPLATLSNGIDAKAGKSLHRASSRESMTTPEAAEVKDTSTTPVAVSIVTGSGKMTSTRAIPGTLVFVVIETL